MYIELNAPRGHMKEGDQWYNTTDHRMYQFMDGQWNRLPTVEENILSFYADVGVYVANTWCVDCPARGTSVDDGSLHFCHILAIDIETRRCTNYDWTKYILERL